jgi:hypothetical protein
MCLVRASQKNQIGRIRGTMACTWHVLENNGFHDLHKGHVYFGQGLSRSGRPTHEDPLLCAL